MELREAVAKKLVHPFDAKLSSYRKFKKGVTGRFGVELELEGSRLGVDVKGWTPHNDGSLRNGGVEYVLTDPVNRDQIADMVNELAQALKKNGAEVQLSPRASTHIHVNMQRETLRTIFYYLTLFTAAEALLCRLAGDTRDGNLFCLPAGDSGNLPNTVERMAAMAICDQFSAIPQRGKYAALNQNTLLTFGSLEVRVFPPTISPKDVMRWSGWLDNLLEMAREIKTDAGLREALNLARSYPAQFIRNIFGTLEIPAEEATTTVAASVELAYEVYRAYKYGMSEEGQMKYVGKVMYK